MNLGAVLTRRRMVPVVVVVVLVAALTSMVVTRATGDAPTGCERARLAATERQGIDTGTGPSVVVIGDSYSVGAGVEPQQSWPVRLPGRVHVDGFSGSGFSADASVCGQVSYADRAARAVAGRPDAVVVVEGGLNDHDMSDAEIGAGFTALLRALDGHDVLVVGPVSAPALVDDVPRVDATLAALSAGFGVTYLSMTDLDLDYLDDGVHPTPAGHRAFGDEVARQVAQLLNAASKAAVGGS